MNHKRATRNRIVLGLSVLVTVFAAMTGLKLGDSGIGYAEIFKTMIGAADARTADILFQYRLPRAAVALAVGACLAVAGVIAQSITRNPLAAPDTLGLTGGAGLAAVAVTLLFPGHFPFYLTAAAFVGGVAAAGAVYLLAYRKGIAPVRLALVGIAVSAFCSSGIQLLISRSTSNASAALIWLGGSLWGRTWNSFLQMLPGVLIFIPLAWMLGRWLDVIRMGDASARSLGLGVERTRMLFLTLSVLLTGSAVAAVGTIGFVGLITPHVARRLVGHRHTILIPVSAVLGGLLILIADSLGRGLLPPLEIPAGLIVAMIGGPYFIFLLARNAKRRLG